MAIRIEAPSGSSATATFTEIGSTTSELALEARFARRLVLTRGDDSYAVLENPESKVWLPAGDYRLIASYLRVAVGKSILIGSESKQQLKVTAGATAHLRVGAPFVSSVTAQRSGSTLKLSYVLRGAAGEVYTISNPSRVNPPKFVIYRGDRIVASGNFRFG